MRSQTNPPMARTMMQATRAKSSHVPVSEAARRARPSLRGGIGAFPFTDHGVNLIVFGHSLVKFTLESLGLGKKHGLRVLHQRFNLLALLLVRIAGGDGDPLQVKGLSRRY